MGHHRSCNSCPFFFMQVEICHNPCWGCSVFIISVPLKPSLHVQGSNGRKCQSNNRKLSVASSLTRFSQVFEFFFSPGKLLPIQGSHVCWGCFDIHVGGSRCGAMSLFQSEHAGHDVVSKRAACTVTVRWTLCRGTERSVCACVTWIPLWQPAFPPLPAAREGPSHDDTASLQPLGRARCLLASTLT